MVASRIEQSEEMHYLSWLRTIIFGQWGLLGISACRLAVCHKGCKTGWSTYSSPILRTSKSPQPVPTSSSFISSVLFTTVAPHARAILLLSDLRVRLNTLIPKQSRKRSRYQKKRPIGINNVTSDNAFMTFNNERFWLWPGTALELPLGHIHQPYTLAQLTT